MYSNHNQIIERVYAHFVQLTQDNVIPINLRVSSIVGTVQDDPFDNWVGLELSRAFPDLEISSAGKLTTPDIIIRDKNSGVIVGIEVKKLIQKTNGSDSRGLTMDYNSCLPCGTALIKVGTNVVEIPCYYLFCLLSNDSSSIVTLLLMHGDFINYDFNLHKQAKISNYTEYNHGPYGEGSVRHRAMYTYPNPLNYKIDIFHQNKLLIDKQYDIQEVLKITGYTKNIIQRDDIFGNSFLYEVIDYTSDDHSRPTLIKDIFSSCKGRAPRVRTPSMPQIQGNIW